MGASHTLQIGLKRTDFAHLAPLSWGRGRKLFEEHAPHVLKQPEVLDQRIETFFIACGRDDFLYRGASELDAFLTELNIEHSFVTSDGGHDMTNWRKYLYEYAQLIFRDD